MSRHRISSDVVPKILDWIQNRSGVEIWVSHDLATPGKEYMTPVLGPEGKPVGGKPHWSCGEKPEKVLTKLEDFEVETPREVHRFRVAIRPTRNGMMWKCTDASSKRIRDAEEKFSLQRCSECNWQGFQKQLTSGKKVGEYGIAYACPTCKNGERLEEGERAYHLFDYERQECRILVPDTIVPLERKQDENMVGDSEKEARS